MATCTKALGGFSTLEGGLFLKQCKMLWRPFSTSGMIFFTAEAWPCIKTFQNVSDLPNIVGAIDGTHIRIAAPPDSALDYFRRYQQHNFIVQAIVDGRKRFLDFASGFPGSMHDVRVLRNSTTFDLSQHEKSLTGPSLQVGGNDIKPYLVGDSAYPLASWLQNPFPEATRDPEKIAFNKAFSGARVHKETRRVQIRTT
ncbi:uncharacterized protein [Montipora capricornis]|uniref:uncharacterized protein n=1 Tax=Montipora capricornis TaxID=246305 RepID=UPI0035F13052